MKIDENDLKLATIEGKLNILHELASYIFDKQIELNREFHRICEGKNEKSR